MDGTQFYFHEEQFCEHASPEMIIKIIRIMQYVGCGYWYHRKTGFNNSDDNRAVDSADS
jgi:hypothetical protein